MPGNKAGGPVKSVYSLLNLLKDEFDFFIVTVNCDLGTDIPYENLKSNVWVKKNETTVYYFSKSELNKQNLIKVINEIKPDIVYLNSFWSFYFSILPLWLKKQNKIEGKLILAPRGMLGGGALSLKSVKKKTFMFMSKIFGLHEGVLFHATTINEEKEIQQFFRNAKIKVASNVNSTLALKNKATDKKAGELRLFFLSRVARVKNVHFALEILSELQCEGTIIYDIYGSIEDKEYWNECESIMKKLPENIKVNYRGELSYENVQAAISSYHYLFMPTLNENYGHSIVESLLSACPVIISDRTPWNDVGMSNCGCAISLEDKNRFKEEILKVLKLDGPGYTEVSKNCITFIEKRINSGQNISAYKELFL